MAQQPLVGQGLIIKTSRSHTDTPHSAGLLWTSDQVVAETSSWQHTTLTRDRHPCRLLDSNPQTQQAGGRRPTPLSARPVGVAAYVIHKYVLFNFVRVPYTSSSVYGSSKCTRGWNIFIECTLVPGYTSPFVRTCPHATRRMCGST